MPIELGGYGAEKADSIFTTGKFSGIDAIGLGLLFVGAVIPLVGIVVIILGIILYFTKGKKNRAWKSVSFVMIIGGLFETIASMSGSFWGGYATAGKLPGSWSLATTGWDKVKYLATFPSITAFNYGAGITPTAIPSLQQSLLESIGGIATY